jgi:crossover junction endodeoxyribonuclease RuvC
MIILGVDPGSVITGYAILKRNSDKNHTLNVIDFGCIVTENGMTTGERLKIIYNEINKLIRKHTPVVMSIENLFFFKNFKTVMPVSQTKGVILLAAAQKNIPVNEFTPLQVKMTVAGYGRAEKKQVKEMIKRILDLSAFNLKKQHRKKDDAYDALGVALCAAFKRF